MYKTFEYLETGDVIRITSVNPALSDCTSDSEVMERMVGLTFTVIYMDEHCDLPNPRLDCEYNTPGYLIFNKDFLFGNNDIEEICTGGHCYWINDGYCDIEIVTNKVDTHQMFDDLFESEEDELQWVNDLNLSSIDVNKRLEFIPPIGTRIRVNTYDWDSSQSIELEGEVIIIDTRDDMFLLKLDGGWQQEFGWPCNSESGAKQFYDDKCYWLNTQDSEIYLIDSPITRIRENEEKLSAGDYLQAKTDLFMNERKYEKYVTKDNFYDIVQIKNTYIAGETKPVKSYVIIDDRKHRHSLSLPFINKNFDILNHGETLGIPSSETLFNNLFESEDDLDWAKQTIENETFKFSDIISELNEGDIIEITGDITHEDGEVMVKLLNEPFKIRRISNGKTEIVWLNNEDNRPYNWDEPTYGTGQGSFIVIQPVMYPEDANLQVKVIEKTDYPF